MAVDPANLDTIEKARTYLADVRRAGREDLVPAAFRRVYELAGRDDTMGGTRDRRQACRA